MKYKLICILVVLALVLTTTAAICLEQEGQETYRYHQHLEEPGYTPCEDHGDEMFCSHLPLVIINTEGQEVPGAVTGEHDRFGQSLHTVSEEGENSVNVSVSIIDNASGNNHLNDEADLTTRSLIRIRGNSSRRFEKSSYQLKFVNEEGMDCNLEVMGMDAHSEWVLYGPYLDKSLVRNYMWYNISGEIMEYAPNVRYCEVFLNGEYRGLYLMVEAIANGDEGRLHLKKNYKGNEVTGYILRIDRPTEADLGTTSDIYSFGERIDKVRTDVSICYPGKNKLTPELAEEIEMDFAAFEKVLYSYDYNTRDYGYRNWIDVDNFVDYYLINEFSCNTDAGIFSTYFYKEPGGKYKLCVWDFNNACDNYMENPLGPAGLNLYDYRAYFEMLCKDDEFVEEIIARYGELRKTWFSDEYLDWYIDSTLEWLGPAVERNNERWADAFTDYAPLEPAERNVYSHEEAVGQLKTWTHARGAWLDVNIDALRAVAHSSVNKKFELESDD